MTLDDRPTVVPPRQSLAPGSVVRSPAVTMFHDVAMLVVIVALGSLRFTGVPWHEYLSIALAAAVFLHLLRQRRWVVSNLSRVGALPAWRSRVNLLLNVLMFVTLVSVTASGLFASKVVWIHQAMSADVFMRWHELHGYTGTWLQWLAALHVAVNWTPLLKRARVIVGMGRSVSGGVRGLRPSDGLGTAALFSLWILGASAAVTGLTMAGHRLVPAQGPVMLDRRDGRGARPASSAEVIGLLPGQEAPSAEGFRRFAMGLAVTVGAAVVGRGVFRLRL